MSISHPVSSIDTDFQERHSTIIDVGNNIFTELEDLEFHIYRITEVPTEPERRLLKTETLDIVAGTFVMRGVRAGFSDEQVESLILYDHAAANGGRRAGNAPRLTPRMEVGRHYVVIGRRHEYGKPYHSIWEHGSMRGPIDTSAAAGELAIICYFPTLHSSFPSVFSRFKLEGNFLRMTQMAASIDSSDSESVAQGLRVIHYFDEYNRTYNDPEERAVGIALMRISDAANDWDRLQLYVAAMRYGVKPDLLRMVEAMENAAVPESYFYAPRMFEYRHHSEEMHRIVGPRIAALVGRSDYVGNVARSIKYEPPHVSTVGGGRASVGQQFRER